MEKNDGFRKIVGKYLFKNRKYLTYFLIDFERGYSYSKNTDGKTYTLSLYGKKMSKREVELIIPLNDTILGYKIMCRYHLQGKVIPLNKKHLYKVRYNIFDDIVKIIGASLDEEDIRREMNTKNSLDYYIKHDFDYYTMFGSGIEEYQFENEEDYKEFLSKGYRIVKNKLVGEELEKAVNKTINQLDRELKELRNKKEIYLKLLKEE